MTENDRAIKKFVAYLMREGLGYPYKKIANSIDVHPSTAHNYVKEVKNKLILGKYENELNEARRYIAQLEVQQQRQLEDKKKYYLNDYRELNDDY